MNSVVTFAVMVLINIYLIYNKIEIYICVLLIRALRLGQRRDFCSHKMPNYIYYEYNGTNIKRKKAITKF